MKKLEMYSFIIFLLGILLALSFLLENSIAEQNPPPDEGGDSVGDWIIETGDAISRANQEINLTGNLSIEDDAKLSLKNVTIRMNCSRNGEYFIEVKFGGELYISDFDSNNKTEYDSSNITKSNFSYLFFIEDGGKLDMKFSKLNGCGYDYDNPGLKIESDDVILFDNNISNNYCGIYCDSKSPQIIKNKLFSNEYGIYCYYSEPMINNNNISNNQNGIYCEGSEPKIDNNHIKENWVGITCDESLAYILNNEITENLNWGIVIISSDLIIEENRISDNSNGLSLTTSNCTILENEILNNDIGLLCDESSSKITNCTILNSNIFDIQLNQDSHPIIISSKFDKDDVVFMDFESNITVKWFLNVKVTNKDDLSINQANLNIIDNENGDFNQNYTTKSDGWAKWIVVTEYKLDILQEIEYTPHTINASISGIYDVLVKKIDDDKNIIIDLDYVIDSKKPVIDNIEVKDISENSATVKWVTDEKSDSLLDYGTKECCGLIIYNSTLTTNHEIQIINLQKNSKYYFIISSKDASGNNVTSELTNFNTLEGEDEEPPEISDIKSEYMTMNSVKITWQTNEKSTSQVEYGITDSYGKITSKDTKLMTSHSYLLNGLESGRKYHFRVISEDSKGNEGLSSDETFITVKNPDIRIKIEVDDFEVELNDEIIIEAQITNNENVELIVDIYFFDAEKELYSEKGSTISSDETLKIPINWTAEVIGVHKIEVIIKINDEEIAKEFIALDVEEKETDSSGICLIAYIFPIIGICCMIFTFRKKEV